MQIYLPIANMSVNILVMIALGAGVGFLSGMFGVGGGFLTTPLLIFFGIPAPVAAASAATQVTGASVSGVIAHWNRAGVDVPMGLFLAGGGVCGSIAGVGVFEILADLGQIDTAIAVLYLILLSGVGILLGRDAVCDMRAARDSTVPIGVRARHHPLIAALPFRYRFHRSGVYISPIAPVALGFLGGVLTVLLGVGGGFIMVPAIIYLLGVTARVVVGTSLLQILIVTAMTTFVHAVTTKSVDIVLAALLLVGGVIGAQLGARVATRLPPERLRLALAAIVLAVAFRMFLELLFRPAEIYTVSHLS